LSKIDIKHSHTMPLDTLKENIQTLANSLSERYGASVKWRTEQTLEVKAPAITGSLSYDDSALNIQVSFGFMSQFLMPKIKAEITDYLNKNIS